jgi:two-component system, cell cycle response regulator
MSRSFESTVTQEAWNPDDTTRIFIPTLADMPSQRVLVVDDDPLTCEHLSAILQASGFEVLTAATGREALKTLRSAYCPIVLSDRQMPDMDGLQLCQAIRTEAFPGYVYFMLLTAKDAQPDVLTGFAAGADDYLSKRVTEAELMARLRTAKRIVGLEQSMRDMIDEKRRQATTDALTGCNNRLYFEKHIARELKRSRRFGGPLSILLMDIDRFKSVNDRFGHGVGDEVLVEFSYRLRVALPRETDWIARIGGEEFVVVLPQTDIAGAAHVAEKVRQAVAIAPIRTEGGLLPVTVSIGVAALSSFTGQEPPSMNELLEAADLAMYQSKQAGRNRVTVFSNTDNQRTQG